MAGQVHRFYCSRCDRFQYGETLAALATAVNYHATANHPSDFANWSESNITGSLHYAAPPSPALPQYTAPHATQSRHASAPPSITDADRAFLAAGYIKWD